MKKISVVWVKVYFFVLFSVFWGGWGAFCVPCEIDYGYEQNNPLFWGNPSDALPFEQTFIEDQNSILNQTSPEKQNSTLNQTSPEGQKKSALFFTKDNLLLIKKQYTLSYNDSLLIPNWVAWHLSVDDLGDADRSNKFLPDTQLPENFYRVVKNDYQFNLYGFDRGHVCPSADRTFCAEDNIATFLMTNMIPQSPDLNRIVWNHMEDYERELVKAGNELYIFAGGYEKGGTGSRGYFEDIVLKTKIENDVEYKIRVPEFCWKIILVMPEGDDDFERVNSLECVLENNIRCIAVCIPNGQGISNGLGKGEDWQQYICSVDYIEELTGFDFFELLSDNIETYLEAKEFLKDYD